MLEFADQIYERRRAGAPVTIVRLVETVGFSTRDRDHVAALTPGLPPLGSLLSGVLNDQLSALLDGPLPTALPAQMPSEVGATDAGPAPTTRALLEVAVSDATAGSAGLSCGGIARLLVHPASDIDEPGWSALISGEPVCLVTVIEPRVGPTEVYTAKTITDSERHHGPGVQNLFNRGATQTVVMEHAAARTVVTVLWPVPRLVVVGGGQIADALAAVSTLLGWQSRIVDSAGAASAAAASLTHADALVVLSHDRAVDGPALLAALRGGAGYIGGLGSARTQAARSSWLVENGVAAEAIGRVYGPAGLDVGANTPAEVAIAITAEILAARSATAGGSLRGRLGPIRPA